MLFRIGAEIIYITYLHKIVLVISKSVKYCNTAIDDFCDIIQFFFLKNNVITRLQ